MGQGVISTSTSFMVKIIIYWWLAISLLAIYTRENRNIYPQKTCIQTFIAAFPYSSTKLGEKQTSTERWTNKQTVNIHAQQVKKWTTGITENGWKHTMLSERTETQKGYTLHNSMSFSSMKNKTKLRWEKSQSVHLLMGGGWDWPKDIRKLLRVTTLFSVLFQYVPLSHM